MSGQGLGDDMRGAEKRGLFRLIADVPPLITQLFRDELENFKQEMATKAKGLAVGAGLFAAAAIIAFLALIMLIISGVAALALVLPWWASALIVAAVLLIITGILIAVGSSQVKRGDPGRVAASISEDVNTIKGTTRRRY
jgi:hypothetical protein